MPCSPPPDSYQEAGTILDEADLLQPLLHFGGLPVGHRGQEPPRHFLAHGAQRPLGQHGGGTIGRVADDPLQALDGANLRKDLATQGQLSQGTRWAGSRCWGGGCCAIASKLRTRAAEGRHVGEGKIWLSQKGGGPRLGSCQDTPPPVSGSPGQKLWGSLLLRDTGKIVSPPPVSFGAGGGEGGQRGGSVLLAQQGLLSLFTQSLPGVGGKQWLLLPQALEGSSGPASPPPHTPWSSSGGL